jgi:hypothetical protein
MNQEQINEIIQCLPDDRTLFHYHKDRYALWLLASLAGDGMGIGEIKRSAFAGLMQKPLLRDLVSQHGDGRLRAQDFTFYWREPSVTFVLTLDRWGGYSRSYGQTTRGDHNLVLQLNFCNQHNEFFHRRLRPELQGYMRCAAHPVLDPDIHNSQYETLAWSRLDIDLDSGEALIEEIQNDWLRYARWLQRDLAQENRDISNTEYRERELVRHYLEKVLAPYYDIWSEAMLAATLFFLHRELGIDTVFYHSFEDGCRLKEIDGTRPPRSLYTDLPRRFCFRETREMPRFLARDKRFVRHLKKRGQTAYSWQKLQLENHHAWA